MTGSCSLSPSRFRCMRIQVVQNVDVVPQMRMVDCLLNAFDANRRQLQARMRTRITGRSVPRWRHARMNEGAHAHDYTRAGLLKRATDCQVPWSRVSDDDTGAATAPWLEPRYIVWPVLARAR